jgi:hypothetical protein
MFRQVVGSLFALAGKYHDVWSRVERIVDPPTFGLRAAFSVEPVNVSINRLMWKFVDGYARYQALWRDVLSEETIAGIEGAIAEASERPTGLHLPADLWISIVYDFLVAYNARRVDPELLLDALIPLYFARTAAFVHEVADLTTEEAEAAVDEVVDAAVRLKPELLREWAAESVPDRALADQPVPEGAPVEELASGSV